MRPAGPWAQARDRPGRLSPGPCRREAWPVSPAGPGRATCTGSAGSGLSRGLWPRDPLPWKLAKAQEPGFQVFEAGGPPDRPCQPEAQSHEGGRAPERHTAGGGWGALDKQAWPVGHLQTQHTFEARSVSCLLSNLALAGSSGHAQPQPHGQLSPLPELCHSGSPAFQGEPA